MSSAEENEMMPTDEKVAGAIIQELTSLDDHIRPNKLRKIICKAMKGTTWTQYQQVLDSLKEKKSVQTCMLNNEEMINPLGIKEGKGQTPGKSAKPTELQKTTQKNDTINTTMKIPLAIVYHLLKKKQKKQRNLEENTKTKFTFDSKTLNVVKSKKFDPKEIIVFTIQSLLYDDKSTSEKHFKTVKYHVNRMVKSFETNPDHFAPKKEGGTFAEQDEIKKRKFEVMKKKKQNPTNNNKDAKHDESMAKKRNRKFY